MAANGTVDAAISAGCERAYRFTLLRVAAGLALHSPPWPAPVRDWLLAPINVTEVFVEVGSHPC